MMWVRQYPHSSSSFSTWEPYSPSFQPFWCHPHTVTEITLLSDEQTYLPNSVFSPSQVLIKFFRIVVTIDEVTLDWPTVGTGFSVIIGFSRLRLSRFTMKFSADIFASLRLVPALEEVLGIRSLFLTILLYHLLLGLWILLPFMTSTLLSHWLFEDKFLISDEFIIFCPINTSFLLILRG